MTTLNPLGDKPFWFNVYKDDEGQWLGVWCEDYKDANDLARIWSNNKNQKNRAIYRLNVTPWIPHDGGLCPVGPDVRVRVMFRDKSKSPELTGGLPAGALFWGTIWGSDDRHDDIIAYQIVE